MLWGGRELLLTEAYDCCLINTKAAKFCCSPPVNFSSTFCLYHLRMEIFGLGKGSIFHGTCLFCCASERNLYTLTGVEMLQQCKAAMVLYGCHVLPACRYLSHLTFVCGLSLPNTQTDFEKMGEMQINRTLMQLCCLMSKVIPWAWGIPLTARNFPYPKATEHCKMMCSVQLFIQNQLL